MDGWQSESRTAASEKRESELFRDPNADITFISSDHVIFRLYGKHVNSGSAGFAILENTAVGPEPAQLAEPSQTLEILFQFVEPPSESRNYRQPSVLDMEPSLLFAIAEAAEKYIVYGAMNICLTRMQQLLSQHPLEVLNHCAKHGYTALADRAAEQTLSHPFNVVASKLTALGLLRRWMIYYNEWRKAGRYAIETFEEYHPQRCLLLARIYSLYLRQIDLNLSPISLNTVPLITDDPPIKCSSSSLYCLCQSLHCSQFPWADDLLYNQKKVPKFSSIT